MGTTTMVLIATIAFVGTHFLMSHPLRAPSISALGERGFMGIYSLVSVATLGWVVVAYRAAPATPMLWPVGDALWAVVTAVMLVASVLLIGSLIGNPALPDPDGAPKVPDRARGVFAVTRHPMLWSFALWGLCHIAIFPMAANIIVAAGIITLSLAGAALQDVKKKRLQPSAWRDWEGKTSYWPFAAIVAGRAQLRGFRPHDWLGGLIVWLSATWLHLPLAGWAAGIWRWR